MLMNTDKYRPKGLSQEKWLQLAMNAMENDCKCKFSLDSLIKAMPVSKGSFYWHFKNREDFLFALVDYWGRTDTSTVIGALAALPEDTSAEKKLWEMMCLIDEMKMNSHELLIRSLGFEFPELMPAIVEIDKKRYEQVKRIFVDLGFDGEQLEMRTRAFITSTMLDKHVLPELDPVKQERRLRLRHEFFIRQ
jgi:AcrR family transcriptional regulator